MCAHQHGLLAELALQELAAPTHLSSFNYSEPFPGIHFVSSISVCLFVLLVIGIKGWLLAGDLGFKCILPGCLLSMRVELSPLHGPPNHLIRGVRENWKCSVPLVDISLSYSLNSLSPLLLKNSYLLHQHLWEWCGGDGSEKDSLNIIGFILIDTEKCLALSPDLSHSGKRVF